MVLPPINGLTREDVAAEVTVQATRRLCCPDAGFTIGFGYAGGGFGPYRRCRCGQVFAKTPARDGNEAAR